MFNRLALIGCGLMGGSLALAMQRACLVRHVVAYSPSEGTLQAALQAGVIHEAAHSPADAAAHADLVVVAVPVAATETVLRSSLARDHDNPFGWMQLETVYERRGDQPRLANQSANRGGSWAAGDVTDGI